MRYIIGMAVGLLVVTTFGCGGSSDEEQTAEKNSSGQSAGTAAVGMAPMGDAAGSSSRGSSAPSAGSSAPAGGAPDAATSGAATPGADPGPAEPGSSAGSSAGPTSDPAIAGDGISGGSSAGSSAGTPSGFPSGFPGGTSGGGSVPPAGVQSGSFPSGFPGGTSGGGSVPPAGVQSGSFPGSVPGTSGGGSVPPAGVLSGSFPGATPGTSGSFPPGSVPGATSGGVAGEGLDSSGGVPGLPGSTPGSEPAPTTYDAFARQAFQQGRERDAIQYLQAWALTSDAGAADVLSSIQWVPELRRPTMAVRFGIGIQLTAPRGVKDDFKPIGSQQQLASKGKKGGGEGSGAGAGGAPGFASGAPGFASGGGEGGFGGDGSSGASESLAKYAGDFGSMFLEQFQSRLANGKFGKVLKDAPFGTSDSQFGGGGLAGSGGASSGAAIPGGIGIPGGSRMPGMPGRRPGGAAAGAANAVRITTGLTMLGLGAEKELKDKAVKENLDVLIVFRVKITVNPAGLINNDVEVIMTEPGKPKEFYNSAGTLNNIKVQKNRELNKDDGVEKEINKIFEVIDAKVSVADLPAGVTPEKVKASRVDNQLLAGKIDDPLAVLTELRFYQHNKLLSDADAAASMAKVVGGEATAKTLLEGKEEDRKKVIEKWLPQG